MKTIKASLGALTDALEIAARTAQAIDQGELSFGWILNQAPYDLVAVCIDTFQGLDALSPTDPLRQGLNWEQMQAGYRALESGKVKVLYMDSRVNGPIE